MGDTIDVDKEQFTEKQLKQIKSTLIFSVTCIFKLLPWITRTPMERFPIPVPKQIEDLWLEVVAQVAENLESREKVSKADFEVFVTEMVSDEESCILEYLNMENIKMLRKFVTSLNAAVQELNLPGSSETQTTITSFMTAPTVINPAVVSPLNLNPELLRSLESKNSVKTKLTPSSSITLVNQKTPYISKAEMTEQPDLLIKVQYTNLLEIPPSDLWNGKEMWKHKMIDMTAILNSNNPKHAEIGREIQRIASSFFSLVEERNQILQKGQSESDEEPSKKRARR